MKRDEAIKLAELEKELSRTVDNVERGVILAKINNIKKKEKNKQITDMAKNTKLKSVTEAPVIMDRKISRQNYNGHNKTVNGVYENVTTTVTI